MVDVLWADGSRLSGLDVGLAADICGLDTADAEWALEEYGRADAVDDAGVDVAIFPAGDAPPAWVPWVPRA